MLEYVDGDRDEAIKKIQKGAAQNEPKKVRDFADTLRALKSIPGADQYIHPVLEVADLLSSNEQESRFSSAKTSGGAKTSMKREGSPSASSAGGSEQARAGTIVPSVDARAIACAPFGDTNITVDGAVARCVVVATGPMVLTDAQTSGACGNDLLIGAGVPANPRWTLFSTTLVPLNVHGAAFGVVDEEPLFVVQMAASAAALRGDVRCTITWAGAAR